MGIRQPRQPRLTISIVGSLTAIAAAVLLRWLLDPLLGNSLALITLYGAIAFAVWLAGSRVAIAAALIGYVACAYLFIEPRGAFELFSPDVFAGFVAYLFTCGLLVAFAEAARAAGARADEEREVLSVTLSSIGDGVITTDVDGHVVYLNPAAEALTGWSGEEAAGQPLDAVFRIRDEESGMPAPSPALRALREGVVVGLANHTVLVRKDGSECPIDDSAAPIRDQSGEVSGCVLVFHDITERRQAERDRAERLASAHRLAAIVESSEVAIVSKSLDGVIQTWNAAAEELFGHSAEEAVGRHISLLIPSERLSEEDEIIATLVSGGRIEHFETERQHRDGRRIQVSLSISPILDDSGRVVGASKMVRDISREREAEADREKFAALIEGSTDFIAISDPEARPLFINRAGLEMVGLEGMEEASQMRVWDFFFPEDQARIRDKLFPEVLERGYGQVEVRFRHFRTGAPIWMAYKVLKIEDASGRLVGFGTVSQEITERRELENRLRRQASDLAENDRRKNEFLATLAHELRGPLAPLVNVLEIWKRSDDPELLSRSRDTLERQLAQIVRLVDDLLDLNRLTHDRLALRMSRVDLEAVLRQAVEACQPLAEALGHDVLTEIRGGPHHLTGDPARLAQVFGNLLNNACKYTPPGGTIRVIAERRDAELVVSVEDSGTGIAEDQLDSIFEMFTRSDQLPGTAPEGLGIGLTLVQQLVSMHGGEIEARSEGRGRGSEFIVRLPLGCEEEDSEPEPPSSARSRAAGRRILVVDDNRDAAQTLATLLGLHGHEAQTAHDGIEAVEAAARYRPEVVLLDIGLPRIDGHEVCRRLRREPWGRDILIVAVTGWNQDEDRRKSSEAGFDAHVVKPVGLETLGELLGGAGA